MPINETFYGFIETTTDALLLFEACRRGALPKISRRLQERERSIIRSGSVFIFDEKESGIKRWTDGRAWSPSRILGNFLIYRELDNREALNQRQQLDNRYYEPYYAPQYNSHTKLYEEIAEKERQRDRHIVGSLTDTYKFLQNGLVKKTISIHLNGYSQHLVSYYSKADVIHLKLATPSSTAELSSLQISPDLLLKQSFRVPPSFEFAELIIKGSNISSPSSSHSSCSYGSKRVSYPNLCPQFYEDQAFSNYARLDSSRRLSSELTPGEPFGTANETYARKRAEPDNFNMPPLSTVTESIYREKNRDRTSMHQDFCKSSVPEHQFITTDDFGQSMPQKTTKYAQEASKPHHAFPYVQHNSKPFNSNVYNSHKYTPLLPSPASMIWPKTPQNNQGSQISPQILTSPVSQNYSSFTTKEDFADNHKFLC